MTYWNQETKRGRNIKWYYFCKLQDLDLYKPTEGLVADWLSEKFHQDFVKIVIITYFFVIPVFVVLTNNFYACGEYIGQSPLLSRLLKGIYKEKSSTPKYNKIYNLDPVINKLEQIALSLIKRSNIEEVQNGYKIQITDFIKTSSGYHQPLFILPQFPENKNLCVASMLEAYLKVTSDLLNNNKVETLFMTTRQSFRAPSNDSMSRWLKMFLFNCGISSEYTPHSIRHTSTSSALAKEVDFSVIKNLAGWSENSKVFKKFYNKPIVQDPSTFAESVLLNFLILLLKLFQHQ
ncbi:Protein of unknown function [Cotesia congregata]|uniref:Tyr recombinase domain-containing protein n=1 Tax=Cotesia congregata TaxID=51543 RepID=A0A8J2HM30_COTCN|nr:Protein of unknown function [Cotesia congregata]